MISSFEVYSDLLKRGVKSSYNYSKSLCL